MPDDLKLSLNREGPGQSSPSRLVNMLLIIVVLLVAIDLVTNIGGWGRRENRQSGLTAAQLEEHAIKLERQQLYRAAAEAWKEYLVTTGEGREEEARIWYRVGTLYQEAGEFESALDAYYRSEAIAKVKEIEPSISLKVSESLEKLGRFAALREELRSRTSIDPAAGDGAEVLAEIGSWKITRPELEKMIEAEIDAQLEQVAGRLGPEQLREQKEKLLESVLREGETRKWLDRIVAEELVYRLAMEEKLYESDQYRRMMRDLEKKLIVQKRLEQEYAGKVTVTEEELGDWYGKNKDKYSEDGKVKPFDEVADQVHAAVRQEKEMQAQSELINRLIDKYDVVFHYSRFEKGK
ncbi:MAG: hypothetical protein JW814_05955 [Candidatus Krumholzibacteriota bacterium]|nr:hypothetical protein [Candidatus Krumholzibacteriota bacterium]